MSSEFGVLKPVDFSLCSSSHNGDLESRSNMLCGGRELVVRLPSCAFPTNRYTGVAAAWSSSDETRGGCTIAFATTCEKIGR